MSFTVIGISHHQAPTAVREVFYRNFDQIEQLLSQWASQSPKASFLLLSTCNRLELYTDLSQSDKQFQNCVLDLSFSHQIFYDHAYVLHGRKCVEHLFKVACSLDSKIVGENQIIGQIKQAFQTSKQQKCLQHQLQRLFEQAFYWARQLKPHILNSSSAHSSWGEVAANWINRQTPVEQEERCLLFVGAGKTIEQCLAYYQKKPLDKLIFCNRSIENLTKLPYASDACFATLETLKTLITENHFDIIVLATSSPVPLIWKEDLASSDKNMTLIDLSLPRNTDPNIALLPGKQVLFMDNLPVENQLWEYHERSQLREAVAHFMTWLERDKKRERIKYQRAKVAQTQQQLLEKALKKLQHGQRPQEVLKIFSHQLIQKLLHESPVTLQEDMVE